MCLVYFVWPCGTMCGGSFDRFAMRGSFDTALMDAVATDLTATTDVLLELEIAQGERMKVLQVPPTHPGDTCSW
jgi:hypothetical protein